MVGCKEAQKFDKSARGDESCNLHLCLKANCHIKQILSPTCDPMKSQNSITPCLAKLLGNFILV